MTDRLDPDKVVQFDSIPSNTVMEELRAFNGPLPPNHFVNMERAKAAILHLQAGNKTHSSEFSAVLAKAMQALNNLTPYL